MAETRTHIGSGLLHLGVKPGTTVGLYSVNHAGEGMTIVMHCLTLAEWHAWHTPALANSDIICNHAGEGMSIVMQASTFPVWHAKYAWHTQALPICA